MSLTVMATHSEKQTQLVMEHGDFDVRIFAPDHEHPDIIVKWAKMIAKWARESPVKVLVGTRHPYALDEFEADEVLVGQPASLFRLSEHSQWPRCSEVFGVGEFWAITTAMRNEAADRPSAQTDTKPEPQHPAR